MISIIFFCDEEGNRIPPKNRYIDPILNQIEQNGDIAIVEKMSNFACLYNEKGDNTEKIKKNKNVIDVIKIEEITSEMNTLKKHAEKWGKKLKDETFVVRVDRKGNHKYTSVELEKELGAVIWKISKCDVDLKKPQKTYRVFIQNKRAFVGV